MTYDAMNENSGATMNYKVASDTQRFNQEAAQRALQKELDRNKELAGIWFSLYLGLLKCPHPLPKPAIEMADEAMEHYCAICIQGRVGPIKPQEAETELSDNDRWMREVLTDFKIPFDDHKTGRRWAFTRWMAEHAKPAQPEPPSPNTIPVDRDKLKRTAYILGIASSHMKDASSRHTGTAFGSMCENTANGCQELMAWIYETLRNTL